jgi:hypothetical protein
VRRLLLVAALVAAAASPAAATANAPAVPLARSRLASRTVLFGASIAPNGAAFGRCSRAAGRSPALVNVYASLASRSFPRQEADAIRSFGAVPMITLEPWRDGRLGPQQPQFALRHLLAGRFDAVLQAWAEGARAWRHEVLLRFAPEMNGTWNAWSAGVVGNTAAQFVAAWRHVHAVFDRAGATNVEWVWSPNVESPGTTPVRRLYPGDRFVDWVGVDGFNWGASRDGTHWQSFGEVFGRTLADVRRLTSKPIVLAEVASAESGGSKARWIDGFFRGLHANPQIRAFVWFDFAKEADWRLDSSPAARAAFARGLASYPAAPPLTQ